MGERRAVDAVVIPDQVIRCRVPWKRFNYLLRCPSRGRILDHVEVHNLAPLVHERNEHIENPEVRRGHREEIDTCSRPHFI